MLEIGSLVDGKYKILNKVGQGGMSVVYLAMNERANKQWAVKEVRKDGVLDFESVKQGLVAETDILKKLNHPYLPSIVDVIDTDDSFIIIMDYIQGNSLDKALKEFGAQPEADVIEWAKMLCDVLEYLHTRQPAIIYRDMKPANVMLKPDGTISLIDFGTARQHKASKVEDTTCLGTRGYAAPEQYGGMGQTDARTDVYCLGATIYHLVTGMNPGEPPYEIYPIRSIDPSLSLGLEKIILKCTQNDPNMRYQSCAELRYDLENYLVDDVSERKRLKKKLSLFAATCIMSVVFAAVSVWGYFSAESAKKADFEFRLANADSVEAYYSAILTDPTRIEGYIGSDGYRGIVDFLIKDGVLSAGDGSVLTQLEVGISEKGSDGNNKTVDVLEKLKKADPAGYRDVCYYIGETYLYYYDVNVASDRYSSAAKWFKESVESYDVAQVYCDISACLQKIKKYDNNKFAGKLSEEYMNLWNEIITLHDRVSGMDDDFKILAWKEIIGFINEFPLNLLEVTGKADIISMIDTVSSDLNGVTSIFQKDNIAELKDSISMARAKIESI